MPVEVTTNIPGLNQSYPLATDGLGEGDDHLRLLKRVLKTTFPNIDVPITATSAQINTAATIYRPFPIGGIIMWSGTLTDLPANFKLCDGQTYTKTDGLGLITTPDLRNRFIVGAGGDYAMGNTGGYTVVTLDGGQIPGHTHTFSGTTGVDGGHTHTINDPGHLHVTGTRHARPVTGTSALYNALDQGVAGMSYTEPATTGISVNGVGPHAHTFSGTTSSTGLGLPHENRPPYYALAFIMRI